MHKYPRTPHLEGSRLQPGDEDLEAVPFAAIRGRPLVVEEKIDGANAAISFTEDGRLLLQSRGHYLTGGPRERQFAPLKQWAATHQAALRERLGSRYVLYGEWAYAKHTIYYDALPHHFLEFDALEVATGRFLDTPSRRALLEGLPVHPVPVLHEGPVRRLPDLTGLIGPALYKSPRWRERLREAAERHGLDADRVMRETDPLDDGEGLYIKVEEGGVVTARFKYVRASFLTAVLDSGSHWRDRPILPNRVASDEEP